MKPSELSTKELISKIHRKIQGCESIGREFSLTLPEISDLFRVDGCAYTGLPFDSKEDMTLERINPRLGYVSGNVVLVTFAANQHKSILDNYMKIETIPLDMKIKLMRKALYQLEKEQRANALTK